MKKLVHLFRACETRFVENVEAFLSLVRLLVAGEMPLQSARFDSCFCEFLCGVRRGREAFNLVTFSLGGFSDRS